MPGEPQSKYDQKLLYVLKTSAAIFAEKGYHSTSIRDISRATGMSLSGLYYYFKSKEELLFLIQDYCFSTVLEDCRKLVANVEDPVRRLKLFIENHLNYFVNNMNEMKVLSHEANSITGDLFRKVNSKKRQYVDLAIDLLGEIARVHRVEEIDIRVAAFSLFGMMNWIYNWYDPQGKLKVSELVDNVTRLFVNGFVAGFKAHELDFAPRRMEEPLSVWRGDLTGAAK